MIDPGSDIKLIEEEINKQRCIPQNILLTHGHLDHIGCVRIIQEKYNMNVYLHEDDIKLSKELKEYCDYFGMTLFEPPIITNIIKNEKNIIINKLNIDIIHTPGHTAGGISYKIIIIYLLVTYYLIIPLEEQICQVVI